MGTIIGGYRDYYRDPFPHSLLSTREFCQEAGVSPAGAGCNSSGSKAALARNLHQRLSLQCVPAVAEV